MREPSELCCCVTLITLESLRDEHAESRTYPID